MVTVPTAMFEEIYDENGNGMRRKNAVAEGSVRPQEGTVACMRGRELGSIIRTDQGEDRIFEVVHFSHIKVLEIGIYG